MHIRTDDARNVPPELAKQLQESGRSFILVNDEDKQAQEVIDYRKQGYSFRDIAKLCGISKSYAHYICKMFGVS